MISVAVLGAVACSSDGDDSSGGGGSSGPRCPSAGTRICERACKCGPECKTGFQTSFGGATIFTWSDDGDCRMNYAGSRCSKDNAAQVDWAACESAIAAASCTGDAFVVPSVCEPPKDGG
jgi:hypothetical protein